MKNFSGLNAYPSSGRIPTTSSIARTNQRANPFNKNMSSKNFTALNQKNIKQASNRNHNRNNSRVQNQRFSHSIEELPTYEKDDYSDYRENRKFPYTPIESLSRVNQEILIQNCQEENGPKNKDSELFGSSYRKIQKIRHNFDGSGNNSEIQRELTDILSLIRSERLTISKKLQELEQQKMKVKENQKNVESEEKGINTDEILHSSEEKLCHDFALQTDDHGIEEECNASETMESSNLGIIAEKVEESEEVEEIEEVEEEEKGIKSEPEKIKSEICSKLSTMLDDMNINCKDILPDEIQMKNIGLGNKQYKQLNETEIIKIQKFFIKKLAEKLP